MTTEATTYDKKFNAKRGAMRSGLQPHEFEVYKTKDGRFGWRKLAAEPAETVAPGETAPTGDDFEPPAFLRRNQKIDAAVDAEQEPAIPVAELTADSHPIAQANAASWPSGPKGGKRKALVEQAKAGALPPPPDFSKPTHARFRAKLAKLVALAEAGDVEGLKAIEINPVSTSPKAMARYRDLAIISIEAQRTAA
jgi:hypothetical protein